MKILVIEDEQKLANFLLKALKSEGYKVTHLNDGSKILNHLKDHHYDLAILDLMLPTMTGENILRSLRLEGIKMPVIVLTAVGETESKTKLLNLGADDYLVKPFSFAELLARIKSVLRRSQGHVQQTQQLKVGDLSLDSNLKIVTRGEKKIPLRFKEYALLEYFMQNPDKVINRNTLIENVWDYNANLFSNTVDSHISLLRKKINEGFDENLIETVHGFGYILKSKKKK